MKSNSQKQHTMIESALNVKMSLTKDLSCRHHRRKNKQADHVVHSLCRDIPGILWYDVYNLIWHHLTFRRALRYGVLTSYQIWKLSCIHAVIASQSTLSWAMRVNCKKPNIWNTDGLSQEHTCSDVVISAKYKRSLSDTHIISNEFICHS